MAFDSRLLIARVTLMGRLKPSMRVLQTVNQPHAPLPGFEKSNTLPTSSARLSAFFLGSADCYLPAPETAYHSPFSTYGQTLRDWNTAHLPVLLAAGLAERNFRLGDEVSYWRADLMGNIRREVRLTFKYVLDAFEHVIKRTNQLFQFNRHSLRIETDIEIFRGDILDATTNITDRFMAFVYGEQHDKTIMMLISEAVIINLFSDR